MPTGAFFRALAGLAVVIVALVGAAIIANTLAAPAARLVTPLIREQIETKVDEAMAQQSQEVQMPEDMDVDEGFAIEDLLALMGLDEDVRNSWPARRRKRSRTPASPWSWPWWRVWPSPFSMRRCSWSPSWD